MNNPHVQKRLPVPVRSLPPEELKEYRRLVSRRSYERNLEKIKAKREANREQKRLYAREYHAANREWIAEKASAYHQREDVQQRRRELAQRPEAKAKHCAEVTAYIAANRDKVAARRRKWSANTNWPELYHKRRLQNDIVYKLKYGLNGRFCIAKKNKGIQACAVSLLGCSVEGLAAHLESQFQPGMSWDNWSYRGWHIDHKIPLAAFDLTDPEQLGTACHYTNLQPMWAVEHFHKGTKIT
jgi:hypothetical protein